MGMKGQGVIWYQTFSAGGGISPLTGARGNSIQYIHPVQYSTYPVHSHPHPTCSKKCAMVLSGGNIISPPSLGQQYSTYIPIYRKHISAHISKPHGPQGYPLCLLFCSLHCLRWDTKTWWKHVFHKVQIKCDVVRQLNNTWVLRRMDQWRSWDKQWVSWVLLISTNVSAQQMRTRGARE
jgi:hypothetical protein